LAYVVGMFGARWLAGNWDFAYSVRLESRASLPFIVVASVVNPIFEELLIAGYVLRALRSRPATIAVAGSVLIRFAYHVYEHWLAVFGILPMGIIFAAFYRRRGQLWPLLVAHALGDLVGLVGSAVAT